MFNSNGARNRFKTAVSAHSCTWNIALPAQPGKPGGYGRETGRMACKREAGQAVSARCLVPGLHPQEGRFHLHAERTTGLQPFNCQRPCRLTLAQLQGGAEDGLWVVYNVNDYIHIARYDATHKASSM